jgi:pimeloyl-ACP methyl ester carboxylesterase
MIFCRCTILVLALAAVGALRVDAAVIVLNDGRTLEGRVTDVAGVAEDPTKPKAAAGGVAVTPIVLLDDGLRRVYIHKSQIREVRELAEPKHIRIRVWQRVADHGAPIAHVGRSIKVTPFDEFGRRTFELMGADGPIPVVQGITEITPVYTRVQGLLVDPRSYIWDMRIATSSIPRGILGKILERAVPQDDPDARLQVVRLYLQAERYQEAREELEKIVAAFPELKDREQEIRQLRQMHARSILTELELRAEAGQHHLVRTWLDQFPADEVADEVAGETLQQVREMVARYEADQAQRDAALERLRALVEQIEDQAHREAAAEFVDEIAAHLNEDTYARLSSFTRLADDEQLTAEHKVSLAISGWMVGTNQATDNFNVTLSLIEVREGVLAYLRSEDAAGRRQILAELHDLEGATVERVAEILARIVPPELVSEESQIGPGLFQLNTAGLGDADDVTYYVQLPPEYNPLRRYSAIVTLNGEGFTPQQQMGYWAGAAREGGPPLGQAGRHGYIVVAPQWQRPGQRTYGYSAREHHAVLAALRDALRRFSIDTDRVFLTGHDIGGDAAWDIGVSHPEHWAGVIPLLSVADRYTSRYWRNGENVAWYFVEGEKDAGKMSRNASDFDRYLRPSFDVTIVEYQGRGYDAMHDEIQQLFDWMNRRRRKPAPREFECATMRPWDNYFWWLEVAELPEKTMVEPVNWPPARGSRPARLRGKILESNKVLVFASTGRSTIWLSPEVVDFQQQITVEVNGRRVVGRNKQIRPDMDVLLEDARTRCDRQHPYWARVDHP